MTDVLTPEQRRRCMSRVKNKNTELELHLRKALWAEGIRYRLQTDLPGKPDFLFVRPKLVVFVDGCFWHGCPTHGQLPKTNMDFWANKIKKNIERDLHVNALLEERGWRVIRCWQHEVKRDLPGCISRIRAALSVRKNI